VLLAPDGGLSAGNGNANLEFVSATLSKARPVFISVLVARYLAQSISAPGTAHAAQEPFDTVLVDLLSQYRPFRAATCRSFLSRLPYNQP
jgi:hypothetical protein